jgi:KaiC/GvpD/RAD55 family RecA-like ATPase
MLKSLRIHRADVTALDQMVNGGLRKGQCLEIAGPPGSGKGSIALEFIRCAVKHGSEVLVVGQLNHHDDRFCH